MGLEEFQEAIKKDDFVIGDSFWLGDWEFEVVGKRRQDDEVVFRWELTKQEFIRLVADNHPEIANPEEFFDRHIYDIVHRFGKGFDVLVGECGATYGTIMNDAIDEAVGQEPRGGSDGCTEIAGGGENEGSSDH